MNDKRELGLGMALGIAIGTEIGVALDNIATYLYVQVITKTVQNSFYNIKL